jgi:hypothetical protein
MFDMLLLSTVTHSLQSSYTAEYIINSSFLLFALTATASTALMPTSVTTAATAANTLSLM